MPPLPVRYAAMVVAAWLGTGTVHANATDAANRNAYHYAVRCFAVAPFVKERGLRSDNGAKAFGMAYDVGARLGYSKTYLTKDVKARTSAEMRRMHSNPAYLNKAISDCTTLKLV